MRVAIYPTEPDMFHTTGGSQALFACGKCAPVTYENDRFFVWFLG